MDGVVGGGLSEFVQADYLHQDNIRSFSEATADQTLLPDQVRLFQAGNDLLIKSTVSDDQIRLEGWFENADNRVEKIVFQDGFGFEGPTVWSEEDILARVEISSAPELNQPITDHSVDEDDLINFTVPADTFVDPDGGDLTLSATLADGSGLPAWLSFDPETGTFSGTPANGDVGTIDIQVTATDPDGESVTDIFTLSVNNTNDAPIVGNAIADQVTDEDAPFTFTVPADTFNDIDVGDVLTFSATLADGSPLPAWLNFDAGTLTFSGTPENGDVGVLDVSVTATDLAGASVSGSFALQVNNVNDAPIVANAILDQATDEDAEYRFTIPSDTFADVDAGDSLTLNATQADGSSLPSWLSFDAQTGTFSGVPGNDDVDELEITVTAIDSGGLTADSTFTLTVNNTNDAPVLEQALPDQLADFDVPFMFTAAGAFADIDVGDTLTFNATLVDGSALPAWLGFDAQTGTFSGTPIADNPDPLEIVVTATDSAGETVSDVFNLEFRGEVIDGSGGNGPISGTAGNDLVTAGDGNNAVFGGAGNDIIDGGDGNDLLFGGDHDDQLTAGSGNNFLSGGDGDDRLQAGAGNDLLTGDAGNDFLGGGDGNDLLSGGDGDDTLDAGGGNDLVNGGAGSDTYLFGPGSDRDRIVEDPDDTASTDTVLFADGIDVDDIWFSQSGNDLQINLIGTDDRLQISDWFRDGHSIEQFQTVAGDVLLESQVQQLVDAMAVFNPRGNGELDIPQEIREDVAATIAASWS